MKRVLISLLTTGSAFLLALAMPLAAKAATTTVVTPGNTQGWSTADTTAGGSVQYVYDPSSSLPTGALELITDNTTTAKAQYMHSSNTSLADITALGYDTKQIAASFAQGDPSYQLPVCLGGLNGTTCTGFTTLVYEPYQNGTVTPGTWQTWDVAAGNLWSTRTYTDGANCAVTAGAGGAPFYTLADLQTACPSATVIGFGVNVGSNNPSYVVETDAVVFNTTTYDFQLNNTPTNASDCKNGGYVNFTDENGNTFRNQGQCVSYVNRSGKVLHFSINSVRVHNNNSQTSVSGNARFNNNTNGGNATSGNASNTNNTTNNVNTGTY